LINILALSGADHPPIIFERFPVHSACHFLIRFQAAGFQLTVQAGFYQNCFHVNPCLPVDGQKWPQRYEIFKNNCGTVSSGLIVNCDLVSHKPAENAQKNNGQFAFRLGYDKTHMLFSSHTSQGHTLTNSHCDFATKRLPNPLTSIAYLADTAVGQRDDWTMEIYKRSILA